MYEMAEQDRTAGSLLVLGSV